MLRKIRIAVALLFFVLVTFNIAALKLQFMPALLAFNVGVILLWLVITLLFGRIYCSTVCPMGVFQDIVIWLSRRWNKRKKFTYSKPYVLLRIGVLFIAIMTFFSGLPLLLSLIEPYSAYERMVVHLFKPLGFEVNNWLAVLSDRFDWYYFYKEEIFVTSISALVIAAVTMVVIIFLSYLYGRKFCNTICPVGTILSGLGSTSLYKITLDESKCNGCGVCAKKCKATCIDSSTKRIDNGRCVVCFDCIDNCRQGALQFTPTWKKAGKIESISVDSDTKNEPDSSRRQFLVTTALAATAASAAMANDKVDELVATVSGKQPYKRKTPLSPPGSVGHKHLAAHCTSCHLCVSKCPQKVLRPALKEYGWSGIMQPIMQFDKGYCEYNCTICGDECPAGAIHSLSKEVKHATKVGQAVFTKQNCVVNTDGVHCNNCVEHCPVEAIRLVSFNNELMIPADIDAEKCIGCGACEYHCPAKPYSAIHVEGLSVHETVSVIKK